MKKAKIIETPLPEAMIHRILSFMSGKEAARSTLLSKSWHNAWLTRPSIDLDYCNFGRQSSYKFRDFAKKTMQRYQDLNLKIESFRLRMDEDIYHTYVDELIVRALKNGATHVQLELPGSVPREVLGSQTLLKLSLKGCQVDGNYVINCSRLKSLTLKNVKFTNGVGVLKKFTNGVGVLKDILRCCCNSLQELELSVSSSSSLILPQEVLGSQNLVRLSLSHCRIDGKYAISCSNLKSLSLQSVTFANVDVFKDIMKRCISLEELTLCSCRGFNGLRGANMYELHKLRRLYLSEVCLEVESNFFTDFASRFPCLEDLSIHDSDERTEIQIASTSLQRISFKPMSGSWRAEFDVPNIRKFTYSGSCSPTSDHLSIKAAASREWDLDISISCNQIYESSWFLNLRKHLEKFMLSRISLSINLIGSSKHGWTRDSEDEDDIEVEAVPKPLVVENLMIDAPSSFCCALLVRLFGICRPKFITCYRGPAQPWDYNARLDILCERLMMQQSITPNCGIPDQSMFGQFGLKRVKLEIYDMFGDEWLPLVLSEPLDTPAIIQKIRFQFIWENS